MNYTQNIKIEQVTEKTLVLGIDIGSEMHFVRTFDYRGRELTKKIFKFSCSKEGFNSFSEWLADQCKRTEKAEVLMGIEPTGFKDG